MNAVRETVGFVCDLDSGTLDPATRLADIGADSLARVAIADQLEERLDAVSGGWRIPDDVLARVATVGELADAVVRLSRPPQTEPAARR